MDSRVRGQGAGSYPKGIVSRPLPAELANGLRPDRNYHSNRGTSHEARASSASMERGEGEAADVVFARLRKKHRLKGRTCGTLRGIQKTQSQTV